VAVWSIVGEWQGPVHANIFPTSKKKEETKQRKNKTEQKERAALT